MNKLQSTSSALESKILVIPSLIKEIRAKEEFPIIRLDHRENSISLHFPQSITSLIRREQR